MTCWMVISPFNFDSGLLSSKASWPGFNARIVSCTTDESHPNWGWCGTTEGGGQVGGTSPTWTVAAWRKAPGVKNLPSPIDWKGPLGHILGNVCKQKNGKKFGSKCWKILTFWVESWVPEPMTPPTLILNPDPDYSVFPWDFFAGILFFSFLLVVLVFFRLFQWFRILHKCFSLVLIGFHWLVSSVWMIAFPLPLGSLLGICSEDPLYVAE